MFLNNKNSLPLTTFALRQKCKDKKKKATRNSSVCQIFGRNKVSNDSNAFIYFKTTLVAKHMFSSAIDDAQLFYN